MKYTIIIENEKKDNRHLYELKVEELRAKNDVYDEMTIQKDKTVIVTRRIGYYQGETYILDEPIKYTYTFEELYLFEGKNFVYILNEANNLIAVEYVIKNAYGEYFATQYQLESEIKQSAGEIELSVNAKIDGVENELNGKIDLKVNTADLVSELNASADIIRLTSNRLIIQSNNFTLTENGTITSKAGTIGGYTITTNELYSNLSGLYDFSVEDMALVLNYIKGYIDLSSNQKKVFDANKDGYVNIGDVVTIGNIINGKTENTINYSGKVEINSSNPKNTIILKDSNNNIITSIGANGINTDSMVLNNVVVGKYRSTNSTIYGCMISGEKKRITVVDGEDESYITPTSMNAKAFNNTSLEEVKKNIKELDINACDLINNSTIYEFNYKTEEDIDKKHYGFVIGDKYNTPNEVINQNKNAIDLYSMCSILWKHNQELEERLKKLENKMEGKV